MFCDEIIEEVFECMPEYNEDYYFDNTHNMTLHLTKGYRIILKTKTYFLCIGYDGVIVECNIDDVVRDGEELEPFIHIVDDGDAGKKIWTDYESALFVGEKLIDVKEEKGQYILTFTDYVLNVVPYDNPHDIIRRYNENHCSYNYVCGLDRLLTRKCDCGGEGEVLLDFVTDYVVRCNKCKKSTWAEMVVIDAINSWNNGETPCDLSDIIIE